MNQDYTGRIRYKAHLQSEQGRLIVAVPCRVGELPNPLHALLDTAAEWSALDTETARELGCIHNQYEVPITLSTRFGRITGGLVRVGAEFSADAGDGLNVEVTWFVSNEWPGPPVLGWRGCLERMRIGLNPDEEAFYFTAAEGGNPADAAE